MLRPLSQFRVWTNRDQNDCGNITGPAVQQLLSLWNTLDTRRRIIVGLAGVFVFAAVLLLARMSGSPSMTLLYAGLEPDVAGEVIAALDQRALAYSVRGDAIYVDGSRRDQIRMSLAGEGLPGSGASGYELLDKLTGFGTTAQMFDAAYWRAKEGELARTILAWPQIKSARVHISNQVTSPFAISPRPVASVTVKLSSGALAVNRARALRYLVASAVAGLSPESVSVIDADRGIIAPAGGTGNGTGYSKSRADGIRKNVERLLFARVGPGNAVVEVNLATALDSEKIVERRFDPQGRVAISSDTQEISGNASDSGGPTVTVASNLPSGNAAGGDATSKSANSESRERINYEVSETTREVTKAPGTIRRLSVAVMVNGFVTPDSNGSATWSPRPDAELAALSDLVKSAVGFDPARGDVVTIKSMEFPEQVVQGTLATSSFLDGFTADAAGLLKAAMLAIVVIVLGMFVVRPILTAPALTALPGPEENAGDVEFDELGDQLQFSIAGPEDGDAANADPVTQLRQIISERQDETVEVLRNWIETSEEVA